MSIQLTKDNSASPDNYSTGDGSDPVSVPLTLNGTSVPASITGSPDNDLFIWANDDTGNIANYTAISVEISGQDEGITWELSLDGATNWASSINLADLDVSVTFQAVQIYARATALNDGSVATQNYISADIKITATSNP